MLIEFCGRLRRASCFQILRARTCHPADRPQPGRNHAAVWQPSDPDRNIDLIVDQVDDLIGQHQPCADVRIGREEVEQDRLDMQPAEHHRSGDGEMAARRAIFTGSRALGVLDLVEDAPACRYIGEARFGQDQLAAGADEELRAQMPFKLGNLAADGRQRHAQRP